MSPPCVTRTMNNKSTSCLQCEIYLSFDISFPSTLTVTIENFNNILLKSKPGYNHFSYFKLIEHKNHFSYFKLIQ